MSEDEDDTDNDVNTTKPTESTSKVNPPTPTPQLTTQAPQTTLPKPKPRPSVALSPLQYLSPSSPPARTGDSASLMMASFSYGGLYALYFRIKYSSFYSRKLRCLNLAVSDSNSNLKRPKSKFRTWVWNKWKEWNWDHPLSKMDQVEWIFCLISFIFGAFHYDHRIQWKILFSHLIL
jgi:hypothetical protein